MVRPLRRQGVPVLKRASWKPQAARLSLRASADGSPARPPRVLASPMCMSALRKVPVVRTTAGARYRVSPRARTPTTRCVAAACGVAGTDDEHIVIEDEVCHGGLRTGPGEILTLRSIAEVRGSEKGGVAEALPSGPLHQEPIRPPPRSIAQPLQPEAGWKDTGLVP